jgi:hypothetical protein
MNFGKELEKITFKHTRGFFLARDKAFHNGFVLVSGKNAMRKYEQHGKKVYLLHAPLNREEPLETYLCRRKRNKILENG